jgi:hypothetical protein
LSEAFLSPNKFFSLDLDPFSSSSSTSSTPSAIRKSSYFFTDNFIDMSDNSNLKTKNNDEETSDIPSAEPFEDPFNNLKNNNRETVETSGKSNSSTRSQSPVVLKSEVTNSIEEATNSVLKELNDKLNDESLPQLSVDNEEEEEDEEEGDDMDSYFKNPPSSTLTNTGDISLNLNITNTEEILPTLNEIEDDSTINNNLLNQFDVALRSGQNYEKINIEPVKLDDTKVEEQDENEMEDEEKKIEDKNEEIATTTTIVANKLNNATNEDDSSLVSLLN